MNASGRAGREQPAVPGGGAGQPARSGLVGDAAAAVVPGCAAFERYPLPELVDRIDWTPFFTTWELKGAFPGILDDPVVGPHARELYDDARRLLARIVDEGLLRGARGRGLLAGQRQPATTSCSTRTTRPDRVSWRGSTRCASRWRRRTGRPNLCAGRLRGAAIAASRTSSAPSRSRRGIGSTRWCAAFEAAHDDYTAIMTKALADRLAEAFAERLHERVRRELWGYAPDEALSNDDLIAERYQGIRPAPGYPGVPGPHREADAVRRCSTPRRAPGSRSPSRWPCSRRRPCPGCYLWHPEARYFGVGRIGRDQLEDYARRARGWRSTTPRAGWGPTWRTTRGAEAASGRGAAGRPIPTRVTPARVTTRA